MIVRPKQLTQEGAADGDALIWDGSSWVPAAVCDYCDRGEMYVSTPAATTNVGTTPIKAAGTTTELQADNFTHTNGRLTYDKAATKKFLLTATISAKSNVADIILSMFVAKTGAAVAASEITRKTGTANDVGAATLVYTLELTEDDYVEIFIAIDTGTANITVEKMVVSVNEG